MILLDKPYVSDFLRQTIREHRLPVVLTESAREFGIDELASAISEHEAIERALASRDPMFYAVSESSIGWIAEHLAATGLPDHIDRFKNKARFRNDTASLFPGLRYREVAFEELADFDPGDFTFPLILKPTVGFFSLGVKRVDTCTQWPEARAAVQAELSNAQKLFPSEVLDSSRFIVESYISGREFAVDAYYDACGEPVVLSIYEHLFVSDADTSDRVYVTSSEIVQAHLERFTSFLQDLGNVSPMRNFPVHVELRLDEQDRLWPIEVNPLRFGGWCTTADLTYLAFGINPYVYLFERRRPNWPEALRGKDGQVFAIVALGNSTGVQGRDIRSFDYEGLLARFDKVLELRRVDAHEYPIFGFVFTQTSSVRDLDWVLRSDLREFITQA